MECVDKLLDRINLIVTSTWSKNPTPEWFLAEIDKVDTELGQRIAEGKPVEAFCGSAYKALARKAARGKRA